MFTWRRGSQEANFKGARLDRALCDMDWGERFAGARVNHLPMINSDHAPILISTKREKANKKNTIFKFQAA